MSKTQFLWFTFFPVILHNWKWEIFWNWLQEIYQIRLWDIPKNVLRGIPWKGLREIPWNGLQDFLRMCYEKFLRICSDIFLRNNHKNLHPLPLYVVLTRNFSIPGIFPSKFLQKSPISVNMFTGFSVKDSSEFPWISGKYSWEFLRIFRKIVTWLPIFRN